MLFQMLMRWKVIVNVSGYFQGDDGLFPSPVCFCVEIQDNTRNLTHNSW